MSETKVEKDTWERDLPLVERKLRRLAFYWNLKHPHAWLAHTIAKWFCKHYKYHLLDDMAWENMERIISEYRIEWELRQIERRQMWIRD